MTVRLYPVADGRCPCCGRTKPTWTPARIIDAIRRWAAANGTAPGKADWQQAGYDHPAYETVYEVFGSIELARELAGVARGSSKFATHCARGHAFDEANTYVYRGRRLCRRCRADQQGRYRKRVAA